MGNRYKNIKELRIGEEKINNRGSLMRIIDYRSNKDISVLFPEYNWIKEKTTYEKFSKGTLSCPHEKDIYKELHTGEEQYNKYGSKMILTEWRKACDIDIYFPEYDWTYKNNQYSNFIRGSINCPYERTVRSVGYLGEGEAITSIENQTTRQYTVWSSMLDRCYNEKYHIKQPTYIDCSVSPNFCNFNYFWEWDKENYYEVPGETMCLDKDIITKGNKIYSEDTCVYVPRRINNLFTKSDKARGDLPIGVHQQHNKYYVYCSNDGIEAYLGSFDTADDAFNAYKEYKENLIKSIADEYYYNNLIPYKLYEAMYNYEVDIDD